MSDSGSLGGGDHGGRHDHNDHVTSFGGTVTVASTGGGGGGGGGGGTLTGTETGNGNGNGSGDRRHSLIEMTTLGFSPYEIPFSTAAASGSPDALGLDEYSLPSINTVTTSLEYGDQSRDLAAAAGKEYSVSSAAELERSVGGGGGDGDGGGGRGGGSRRWKGQMSHGFFFGDNSSSSEFLNNNSNDINLHNGNYNNTNGNSSSSSNSNNNNNINSSSDGRSGKGNGQQFIGYHDDDDDDLNDDDDDIPEIYSGRGDVERWVRASQHSFKPSPEICKREVLSKRIKDVGFIGQNLGIGHLTGLLKEDAVLIPKVITPHTACVTISESSPLQQEVRWGPPSNASSFSALVYEVEVRLPDQEEWTLVASVRHTVFRMYHTDHALLVGKQRVERRNHDLTLWLQLCCRGQVSYSNGGTHWTRGPQSKDVRVVFLGYGTKPEVLEQTAL